MSNLDNLDEPDLDAAFAELQAAIDSLTHEQMLRTSGTTAGACATSWAM